jgi:hypothetical protein
VSQRDSGYARVAFDQYETPEWVTRALLPHIPHMNPRCRIWEPACGSGKMARVLDATLSTDIQQGIDFFSAPLYDGIDAIITNPPYSIATKFIQHALSQDVAFVAMLLRTDFDHAKSRRHLFADHPAFAKKLVLTKRIQWFEDSKSSPSFNHAWFIWDWCNDARPVLSYHFED